jgi:endonuclease/exonuclease/phosphatase family metal-dependent hydrolase
VLSRQLEWAVAGGLAASAAARLAGADRLRPLDAGTVPLLSFTPQAAAGAWLGALLLRGRGAGTTAALAGAALTVVMAPRVLPRRQPPASGPVLRVLTANLLAGRACANVVVDLVRSTRADVLFLQELTDDAVIRLSRAGLGSLLPHELASPRNGSRANAIYARYPLSARRAATADIGAQPAARVHLPAGQSAQLICIHLRPPKPRLSRSAVTCWRDELLRLPPPGDPPVVLAGDFNSTLDHAQFRRMLRRGHVDAASQAGNGLVPTWGPEPGRRPGLLALDHVLLDPRCAVRATSAHLLPGSDHRAVFAEFRLPGAASPAGPPRR